jgi:hypothetical protein
MAIADNNRLRDQLKAKEDELVSARKQADEQASRINALQGVFLLLVVAIGTSTLTQASRS